jgi:hypothetical protein
MKKLFVVLLAALGFYLPSCAEKKMTAPEPTPTATDKDKAQPEGGKTTAATPDAAASVERTNKAP